MNILDRKKELVINLLITVLLFLSLISVLSASIDANGVRVLSVRWVPMICLALIVAFLVVEKRLGFVQKRKNELLALWNRNREGKKGTLVHHRVTILATLCLVLLYTVLLMLSHISKLSIFLVYGLSVVVLILQLTYRIGHDDGSSPARLFACVALVLGLAMAYSLPFCSWLSWDDEFHFCRVYDISTFSLFDKTEPLSAYRMKDGSIAYSILDFMEDPTAFSNQMLKDMQMEVPTWHRVDNPITAIGNLPAIFAMMILNLFGGDFIKLVIVGRVAAVIAYAAIIGFSIRRMKSGAYLFSAICLLPCPLFLASVYSYDYWLTAWVAYSFAYFISEMQCPEKKIVKKDMICMLGSMMLACLVKQVYFFMFIPFFLLPNSKFEDSLKAKKFRRTCLILMLVLVVVFVAPMIIRQSDGSDMRGGADVSSTGQIKYILAHPFEYLKTLWKFVCFYVSVPQFIEFSNMYAYITLRTGGVQAIWGTFSLVLLLYAAFTDRSEQILLKNKNWIYTTGFLSCLLQVCLVATSLYIAFTPVGHSTVLGCQFRYFFPVMLPLLYFMVPTSLVCTVREKVQKIVVFGGLSLAALGTVFEVYIYKL